MFSNTLFRLLSSQYRFPTGLLGKYVGKKMDERNDRQSDWVISLLDLKPDDKILDIGFATGRVLKKIAKQVKPKILYGLDPSETMGQVAAEKLKEEISSGKAKLFKGYIENPPFSPNLFTKIFAVHVVYFWEDLDKVFPKIYKIAAKGALIAIYFVSPIIASNKNFHEYSEDYIKNAMISAGFKKINQKYTLFGKQKGICILAVK